MHCSAQEKWKVNDAPSMLRPELRSFTALLDKSNTFFSFWKRKLNVYLSGNAVGSEQWWLSSDRPEAVFASGAGDVRVKLFGAGF